MKKPTLIIFITLYFHAYSSAFLILRSWKLAAQEFPIYDLPDKGKGGILVQQSTDKNEMEYTVIDGVLSDEKIKQRDRLTTIKVKDKKKFADTGADTAKNIVEIKHTIGQNEDWIEHKVKDKPAGTGQIPIIVDGVFKTAYYERKKRIEELDTADISSVRFVSVRAAKKKYSPNIVYGVIEVITRPNKIRKPKPLKIEPMY